jgi:methionyl-tRNA formyltransferase
MYRVGIIGAVTSTAVTIKALHKYGFSIVGVLGYEPDNPEKVSGWNDLKSLSSTLELPYQGFKKINEQRHIDWMKKKEVDILFAVGFSQLLNRQWLKMPNLGCIGFHPTSLPKGRGRAPLAWIVLEERKGAANFFLMGEGADDGPIFVQEPFFLKEDDDATSVQKLILDATRSALNKWLPELKKGAWSPVPQDELLATWYGKRTPLDGLIDWRNAATDIDLLIKGSTTPHPGAYTFHKGKKLRIWKSVVETEIPIQGVTGRILLQNPEKGYLVQCGEGLLWLNKWTLDSTTESIQLRIGEKLGFNVEEEIYKIWRHLKASGK